VTLGQKYSGTPLVTLPGGTGLQSTPGNLGRNTFRSGSFSNFDFSVLKDTMLTERMLLQVRAEFFNIFNQHAFGIPTQVLSNPGFGVATGTALPERQIQFGLKLLY